MTMECALGAFVLHKPVVGRACGRTCAVGGRTVGIGAAGCGKCAVACAAPRLATPRKQMPIAANVQWFIQLRFLNTNLLIYT